jgi:hypothetical protein
MKPRCSKQRNLALTKIEVVVIIAVLAVLAAAFLPALTRPKKHRSRLNCVNCLHEIGTAYHVWAGDHEDKFPFQIPNANGGTMELAATGDTVTTFQIMSNELSTPEILLCPADTDRAYATNFASSFTAKNISYFIGLDADQSKPQMFLSGDDNFAIGGVPVKSGLLELSTNDPVAWTAARHRFVGNIGLADGSVCWQTDAKSLVEKLHATGVATNRLAIP